ncbi:MAG: hypothetical protein ABI240_01605 [Sphingomonas sp.]
MMRLGNGGGVYEVPMTRSILVVRYGDKNDVAAARVPYFEKVARDQIADHGLFSARAGEYLGSAGD